MSDYVRQKKDLIQRFHDYQVEWLTSHCDIELVPEEENLIVRFLHDTANCFMMEMEMGEKDKALNDYWGWIEGYLRGEQNETD